MKITYTDDFLNSVINNKFLRNKYNEFQIAIKEGKAEQFLDENPDFIQMLTHLQKYVKVEK